MSSDGDVDFDGVTRWAGTVAINGVAQQNGDATVIANTTINANVFDLDGTAGTNSVWLVQAPITVNADRVESSLSNDFNGTMTINGSLINRATINLTNPAHSWSSHGTLNLQGNAVFFTTRLAGSKVEVHGTLNATAKAQVDSDALFTNASTLHFTSNTANLRMRGNTRINSGTTVTGNGTLTNGNGGSMTLDHGLSLAQADLYNSGSLRLDDGIGHVIARSFEQSGNASNWIIQLAGENPGDHDQLLLIQDADLAGRLTLQLTNGYNPQLGDDFQVLNAAGNINGTFNAFTVPVLPGGLVWHIGELYTTGTIIIGECLQGDVNHDGVVDSLDIQPFVDLLSGGGFQCEADINKDLVVDSLDIQPLVDLIAGNAAPVPEPSGIALLGAGALALIRRRR